MKRGPFEEKLVNKLGGYETNIDLEGAWNALETKRHKPNKRRSIFLFLFLGLGLLISGISFKMFINDQGSLTTQTSEDKILSLSNEKLASNTTSPEHTKAITAAKTIVAPPYKASSNRHDVKTKINKPLFLLGQTNEVNNTFPESEIKTKLNTKLSASNKTSKLKLYKLENFTALDGLSYLVSYQSNLNESLEYVKQVNGYKKRKQLWLGLTANYGKSFKNLSTKDSGLVDLVQFQNQHIQALDAYSINLFIERKTRGVLFWRAGAFFNHRTDRLTDQFTRSSTETRPDQLVEIIRKPDGTEEQVFGEGDVYIYESIQNTNYLRYQQISLNLQAGLKLPLSKSIDLNLFAGLAYALQLSQKGQTISSIEQRGSYSELANLPYKTAGLIQGQAGLELNYKLNKKTQFVIGTLGSLDINNLQQTSSGIIEKHQFAGIQIGLKRLMYSR